MESKIEFKKMLITPKLAKEFLANNNSNRRVSEVTVNAYANDMSNGR